MIPLVEEKRKKKVWTAELIFQGKQERCIYFSSLCYIFPFFYLIDSKKEI